MNKNLTGEEMLKYTFDFIRFNFIVNKKVSVYLKLGYFATSKIFSTLFKEILQKKILSAFDEILQPH